MSRRHPSCLLAVALTACASRAPAPAPDAAPPPSACRPAGVSGSPRTIAEVVALANALPRPLALTCFLESLDRPLEVHAALSTVSLQPAPAARSPRIFLFAGDVILSVVPDGKGQSLVEMGQLVAADRSVKAELRFPIAEPVAAEYPFAHVRDGDGTTCRFCHPNEEPAPTIAAGAFSSGAFKPVYRAKVDLESLRAERSRCDERAEPNRCAILGALFDHGEVRGREFPDGVPTAFDHP